MPQEKKPRLLKDPGDWWKMSRYVPEGKQDLVLLAAGGLAAFFLVLAVIAFTELAGAQAEGEKAGERAGELETGLRAAEEQVEKLKRAAEKARAEAQGVEEGAAEIEAELAAAARERLALEATLEEASGTSERLDGVARTKDRKIDELGAELGRMKKRLAEAAGFKAKCDELQAELGKMGADIQALREQSTEVLGEKADLVLSLRKKLVEQRAFIDKVTSQLQERERELLALADRNEQVEAELRRFPTEPFPEEEAAHKYREILDEVAEHYANRDERIAILFRAKLYLAGTSYQARADAKWKKEQLEKQADVDRKARAVFEEAMSKIGSHRGSHDQNVAILTAVLERVRGSKYEAVVQREIDKQHELKAKVRAGD